VSGHWSRASIERDRARFERECAEKDAARRAETDRKISEYNRLMAEGMTPDEAEIAVELAALKRRG